MRRNLLIPVAFVTGMFAVSCSSGDKHAIAVPKEAAFVFHINGPSLSSKLSWADIKATSWFKEMQSHVCRPIYAIRQIGRSLKRRGLKGYDA